MQNEKTVQELLNEQNEEGMCFLVPHYQRGYRWQRANVLDLLYDISDFIHSDKKSYSLQPLVVYHSEKDNTYHVVDGQQRLTTISILLGYLGEKQIDIKYESRKEQQNRYVEGNINIDQHLVNQAYLTIQTWFEQRSEEKDLFVKLLKDKLDKKVNFIWYCTTDNEVATFIRLNKDKISLTNAELAKAMLLKRGNFTEDSVLMQKNIATEWNKIENTLNDDAFWCFIRPIEDNRDTRIDFLFEIIKDKNMLHFTPTDEIGNDRFSTFRYFYDYFKEKKASAFDSIWNEIRQLYNIFMHWYNEIEMYHYIGFLIIDNSNCILNLLDEWMKSDMIIPDFKKHLKSEINKVIEKSGCNDLSKQYKYNEERASDKTKCKPILLLFNIQRIIIINRNMNQRTDTQLFNKFPFYLYKSENWDVEHIASNTDNDLTQPSEQKEWLKTFLLDSSISDDNKNRIKCFLGLEESGDFEDIRQKLEEEQQQVLHKEEHLNDAEKNQIWNFCLLDEHTNRSYGNSVFPVKRRIIMGKEMGKEYILNDDLEEDIKSNVVAYVPLCTKDVFVKAYTANSTTNREWSKTDAKAYKKEIFECLNKEFNVKF
ncbi:DUF262 domain-containing protein [Bacteroides finegoldii]|jgi:hypothetical protein|uniref:DUF262 domain-containing protein n=1 Tax=Bacteroides finegoldii TaxID=338188 RepID=UPI0026DB5C40|nr:DUF262 domain-containing protein [Bacteroides finegoldii]